MTRALMWWILSSAILPAAYSGDQDRKVAAIREIDRRSPGYADYTRANSLFTAKRFPEALDAVQRALGLDPKLAPALTLHAKLAMATSRFEVARRSLELALASDPASAYARFLYGLQFYMTNNLQLALPQFEQARQMDPNEPRAALYLGLTYESLGRTDEALAMYEAAVRLEKAENAPAAETFLVGSRLLLLLGRLDDSEIWVRSALRLAPNSRDAHFEFARVLLQKGEMIQSSKEGEAALKLAGGSVNDSQIHYLLIRTYKAHQPALAAEHAAALRSLETRF